MFGRRSAMAANNTGDDITFGQTNAGQDGTELRADANDNGGYGNDYVLQLTVSPIMLHRNAIDGLRSAAVKQGRGVVGLTPRSKDTSCPSCVAGVPRPEVGARTREGQGSSYVVW
jgi:hypothetical protein